VVAGDDAGVFQPLDPVGDRRGGQADPAAQLRQARTGVRLQLTDDLALWGLVLAVMNLCFYEAVARLPLGTVAAIEFVPVIALAAAGARGVRNAVALLSAVTGVFVLTDVRLAGAPLGFVFAFANAALFGLYVVLAHRVAQNPGDGVDGLAAAMLVAAVCVAPLGAWHATPALSRPGLLGAGIGVGVSSSVIPYVCDQLAMARMTRATYALLVSLLPATAAVIGAVVLGQLPMPAELAGIGLVVLGTALHRESGQGAVKAGLVRMRPTRRGLRREARTSGARCSSASRS
jgi:inner membrane transporter RhtA